MLFPDLYNALRAHKALVLLGTLMCMLATLVVTDAQKRYYEAAAVVRIEPTDQDSNPNDQYEASQRLARTYAEVYQRGAVNQQISALLADPATGGARSARILPDELVAQQVKDLDLLSVGALTTNPQRSAQIANVGWRALDRLSDRDRLILVTPAAVPTAPASPNLKLNLALSLLAGLILSTGLALILHALRQPVPDAEGLERDFGQPVLATIPQLDFGRRAAPRSSKRPTATDDDNPSASSRDDGSDSLLSAPGARQAGAARKA